MIVSTCRTCTHYRQHYVLDELGCIAIDCGHCTYPRLKHREPENKGCQHYVLRLVPLTLPDRESVVRFLTGELLQYILRLNLPEEKE